MTTPNPEDAVLIFREAFIDFMRKMQTIGIHAEITQVNLQGIESRHLLAKSARKHYAIFDDVPKPTPNIDRVESLFGAEVTYDVDPFTRMKNAGKEI